MDNFDTNVLNSTQEYVIPAVEVDGKAGVKESLFVFSVARGVVVLASGLSTRMKFQTRGAASWLRNTLKELVQ